mgnify:CR=1 FL=1
MLRHYFQNIKIGFLTSKNRINKSRQLYRRRHPGLPLHDKNLSIAIFSFFNLLLFYAYMFITPNESLPD